MLCIFLLFLVLYASNSDPIPTKPENVNITKEKEEEITGPTRRIINGREITTARPYMVYLRPLHDEAFASIDKNWLCGGVIIAPYYILTSAACIEDIKYFYVVSGTYKWVPGSETNECIENGALRAMWKCISRTYRYDGHVFNNIRWMINDIAVVLLESPISFTKRVKGCDFIPQKIMYNNFSRELENPGTKGYLAGWGSTDRYTDAADLAARNSVNSPVLLETETIIITKENCKARWLDRYAPVIENMICTKAVRESFDSDAKCMQNQVLCRQLILSEEEGPRMRRFESNPDRLLLNSAASVRKKKRPIYRRRNADDYGGFCENDHGGPLIVGEGKSITVIAVMSAFRVNDNSKKCYGPFLYTSVYSHRQLINCALHKTEPDDAEDCKTVLREQSSVVEEESFNWGDVPRQRTIYEDDDEEPSKDTVTSTKEAPESTNTPKSDN